MNDEIESLPTRLLSELADVGSRMATGADITVLRQDLDRIVSSRSRELADLGLKGDSFLHAPTVFWEMLGQAIEDVSFTLEFLWWYVTGQCTAEERSKRVAGLGDNPFTAKNTRQFSDLSASDRAANRIQIPVGAWRDELTRVLPPRVETTLADLEALPWGYFAFVRLPFPTDYGVFTGGTELNDVVVERIADNPENANFDIADAFFRVPGETLPQRLLQPGWEDRYYLSTYFAGFVPQVPAISETFMVSLRDRYNALLGLCVACGLLRVKPEPAWDHVEPVFVFGNDTKSRDRVVALRWLPVDESSIVGALEANVSDDEQGLKVLKRQWQSIGAAFRRDEKKVLTAGRWLLSSYTGSDQLLQFIQATIAIESLLGDEQISREVGIQKLLANRVAYLIGRNTSDRVSLINEFGEIYKVRSKLVHEGSSGIGKNVGALVRLRQICGEVIKKELELFSVI
jgi:hypothetical protein